MKLSVLGRRLDGVLNRQYAESWDNVSWMVGPTSKELEGIVLAVDPSPEALSETIDRDSNLLLTHHPLIFDSLDRIVEGNPVHETIIRAIRNEIGIYSAHTNVDSMPGGLNDYFADCLGLEEVSPIRPHEDNEAVGLGRQGKLPRPVPFEEVREWLVEEIDPTVTEWVGPVGSTVRSVGICTGSGGDFIGPTLSEKVDVYVTADVDHHEAMLARKLELPVIILDHYEMESVFLPLVDSLLSDDSTIDVTIETYHRENPYRRWVK